MKNEDRLLLEDMKAEWEKWKIGLPKEITLGDNKWNPQECIDSFSYWLIRYSPFKVEDLRKGTI
jgi:hypothetical protein